MKTWSGHTELLPRYQYLLQISSQNTFGVSLGHTTRSERPFVKRSGLVELQGSSKKRVSSGPALFLGRASGMTAVTNSGPTSSRICTEGGRYLGCVTSELETERFVTRIVIIDPCSEPI